MTYTVVAAAALSSLIWNQGALRSEVAVGLAGQGQRLAQGGAELAGGVQLAHGLEASLDLGQERPVLVVQLARLGHLPVEALVGKTQHAVGQIAPGGDQLVVVALDKILPGELGVAGLGRDGGQVEAQGVGVVLAQKVGHLHRGAAALAELAAPEVEVFMVTRDKKITCQLGPEFSPPPNTANTTPSF